MRSRAVRAGLVAACCTLCLLPLGARSATAGIINLTYMLSRGAGKNLEDHWFGGVGSMTLSLQATRATPSASFGLISGGSVSELSFVFGRTAFRSYNQTWTVGGSPTGVPPLLLPSIMGSFAGLTASGSAFAGSSGGFVFTNPSSRRYYEPPQAANATVGIWVFSGAHMGSATGTFHVQGTGNVSSGTNAVCFNKRRGDDDYVEGVCRRHGVHSSRGTDADRIGFWSGGAEVDRTVAIEPVPEPTTTLLLGLGLTGMAWGARRIRRP